MSKFSKAQSTILVRVSEGENSQNFSTGETLTSTILQFLNCNFTISISVKSFEGHFNISDSSKSSSELGKAIRGSREEGTDIFNHANLTILVQISHGKNIAAFLTIKIDTSSLQTLEKLILGESSIAIGIKLLERYDCLSDISEGISESVH